MRSRGLVIAVLTAISLTTSIIPAAAATTTYTSINALPSNWLAIINAQLAAMGKAPLQTSPTPTQPAPAPTQPAPTPAQPTPTPTPPAPAPTPAPTPAPAPTTTPAPAADALLSAPLTSQEAQLIGLVNKERTSRGLNPLATDMRLVRVSRMKSMDMINNNYFGHQSPVYGSPFDLLKSQGITYKKAGENLAGTATVERAHTILMNSAGHRANILDPAYTKIGVGIIKGGPYGYMFTQTFLG